MPKIDANGLSRAAPKNWPSDRQFGQRERDRLDAMLDEALKETFPASDPVAVSSQGYETLQGPPSSKRIEGRSGGH